MNSATPSFTPSQAAQELLLRRLARKSLIGFTEYTNPIYLPAPHHELIAAKLEAVACGEIKRLMIFMPPRHGKSELASRRFPAWFLGHHPAKQIIASSYGADLANDFGREVRNIVASPEYHTLFDVSLSADSQSANRWHTDQQGIYVAAGVGTAITGRGGHILLIDDPFKDREEADSELVRNKVWNWYTSTAYTRLMPDGAIILIQCMTGDTPVMLGDGTEKPLCDIRPGDEVATFKNGVLSTSAVKNWASNGRDCVYEIKTISGKIVKANARHPFLVSDHGKLKWITTKDLRPGHEILRVSGENGRVKRASGKDVKIQSHARDIARLITIKNDGLMVLGRHLSTLNLGVLRTLNTAMELLYKSTSGFWQSKTASAQYASNYRGKMSAPIGAGSFALTTVTKQERLGRCFAMTATLLSGMRKLRKLLWRQPSTSDFTLDAVVEITAAGVEEVFDIQIADTENFIANGLVSHNTRWHDDDLAGRLLEAQQRGGDQWEVLSLPAISEIGQALWPAWYPIERLEQIKSVIGPRDWNSLYQQNPVPDTGDYFKRNWFRYYENAPKHLRIYGASDYAVTDDGGDYTVHLIIGVDPNDDVYVLDMWRDQTTSDIWIESFIELCRKWEPLTWAEESGQILKSVGPFIDKRQRETKVYTHRKQFTSASDKPTRARAIQARMSMGKVYFPIKLDLTATLERELLRFPAGKNDDQVDTLSLIGRMLAEMVGGAVPKEDEKPRFAQDRTFDELVAAQRRKRESE